MSTVVLDTNVLASGFIRREQTSPPIAIVDAWRTRSYTLVISEHILTELAHTLERPYFRRYLTQAQIEADLALLRRQAIVAPITVTVTGVATHPEDDLILATAVSAEADYLVTGDAKLQQLNIYEGVTILSPRAFLNLLNSQEPDRSSS